MLLSSITVIAVLILFVYVLLLKVLFKVWCGQWSNNMVGEDKHFPVTIIIPARNEEHTITSCIERILGNKYPEHLLQVLVIDDHSTDSTRSLVENTYSDKLTCLSLPDGLYGKKQAITFGIKHAKHEIILLTDADTKVGPLWIRSHSCMYVNPVIHAVTASVFPSFRDTFMGRFQFLDYLSVMAATAFGFRYRLFWLASGANMSFRKDIFIEVSGYHGNDHIASGDDVFLFKKLREYNEDSIAFVHHSDIMVRTASERTWGGFVQQRKRWATKTGAYASRWLIAFQGFVCMAVIYPFLLMILSAYFGVTLLPAGLFFLCIKLAADYIFLKQMESSIQCSGSMKNFIISSVFHTAYIFCAFWWVFFPSPYRWKSRRVNS